MFLPLTGIVHLVNSAMIYACYLKLNSTYKNMQVKDDALKNFLYFILYIDIFQFLVGLGHLPIFFGRTDIFYYTFNFGYIVGHAFLYLAEACIVLVPMYLYFSRDNYRKYGLNYSKLLMIFGAIITIINIINPTNPVFDEKTGVTIFNVPAAVSGLIPLITIISVGFAGILFLAKSMKLQGKAKIKAIILGISMILIVIGGSFHELAKNIFEYFLADFLAVVAFFVMMVAIYYEQISSGAQKN
ncbi:MAG: hypothetical protein WA063_00745 [Minisyncoccia bacterium]